MEKLVQKFYENTLQFRQKLCEILSMKLIGQTGS